jgi:hypothetical protein
VFRYTAIAALIVVCACVATGKDSSSVLIYDGVATQVTPWPAKTADLWISTMDLKRATGYEIKPQGVCRGQLCFPLPKNRQQEFVSKAKGTTWFNVSEFARLIKQPFTTDQKNAIWYFGPRSEESNAFVSSLEAPNFTLPDLSGKMHSLSDFRGKKVLLVTWASW